VARSIFSSLLTNQRMSLPSPAAGLSLHTCVVNYVARIAFVRWKPCSAGALSSGGGIHYNGAFMPVFRIHRMKDTPRAQFRWAPHVSGAAAVKPKDFEISTEVEAENEYAAWALLRSSETPLVVGDVLELPSGQLRICKYVGFEEARWFVPEPLPAGDMAPNVGQPEPASASA
jgi:hypothetical protein